MNRRRGSERRRARRRNKLMKRLGVNCAYCGVEMQAFSQTANNFFTLDHVIPKADGGRDGDNIVPCCLKCNNEKGSQNVDAFKFYKHSPLTK